MAVVAKEFFGEWEIIIANRESGEEANVASIMGLMYLAASKGTELEFFSLMPDDVWKKYVTILAALFYTLDENNIKRNWTAYEALKNLFEGVKSMPRDRDMLLDRLQVTAKRYNVEHFFESFQQANMVPSEQMLRVRSALSGAAGYDVFISKTSANAEQAKELFYFLERSGIRTFLSEFSISSESDSDFQEVIERALESTKHLVVLGSSPASFTSDWVKAEWRAFLAEKRAGRKPGNVITIRCGSAGIEDLPFALRPFQSLAWNEECFAAILPFLKR